MELSLREVLGIAKKENHDYIIDLIKRKQFSTEEEYVESHYMQSHWARARMETPVRIGDMKEPMVALIDHRSKIDLMSMDTKHGWRIRVATRATEELHG